MPLIASVSGIRGTVPDALTPEEIIKYTNAFWEVVHPQHVVIGTDGRKTGKAIEIVVSHTLLALGCNVTATGIVPTPTVQMEIERHGAGGGIAISASHNPKEWNGLKFLGADGMFLRPDVVERLIQIAAGVSAARGAGSPGKRTEVSDAIASHIARVLAMPATDRAAIRARRFRVAVDAVNAAGSVAIPSLLRELGCEVIPVACDGSGEFPHTPEPLPENLGSLCDAVRSNGADLGIAVDPDADRLVLIDERGEPIGEEYTIVLCVDAVLATAPGTTVVINQSTTRAVEDVAARHGSRVERTPVGEINVAAAMQRLGAVIGGEGSGGVIYAPLHLGRDSLAGTAIALSHLARTGQSLSSLRATYPSYEMLKRKRTVDSAEEAQRALERAAAGAKGDVRRDDGVRITLDRAWIHMRRSNTEPIVRIIVEAPDKAEATRLADDTERLAFGG